ncbi:hypothetical protein XSR1_60084 [Xenorhabdus szentirmaii DSM 16338]|uniref:Uncharacterized protein n=1 Tax=Xenorhabdus szentirmaii DSM 16338 TaxID=1427518 RepID=W1J2U4_9GAMM|nr:hypothetical protein XSR1_60084 [Xenorhabdus szentirmaii DSM 16338]
MMISSIDIDLSYKTLTTLGNSERYHYHDILMNAFDKVYLFSGIGFLISTVCILIANKLIR